MELRHGYGTVNGYGEDFFMDHAEGKSGSGFGDGYDEGDAYGAGDGDIGLGDGDGFGDGYHVFKKREDAPVYLALSDKLQLPPEYAISALSLTWAIANTGLERRYAWT